MELDIERGGCHSIRFSVESRSQKMLDIMKKGINLGEVKQVFDLCRKVRIRRQAFFLLGIPGETPRL